MLNKDISITAGCLEFDDKRLGITLYVIMDKYDILQLYESSLNGNISLGLNMENVNDALGNIEDRISCTNNVYYISGHNLKFLTASINFLNDKKSYLLVKENILKDKLKLMLLIDNDAFKFKYQDLNLGDEEMINTFKDLIYNESKVLFN